MEVDYYFEILEEVKQRNLNSSKKILMSECGICSTRTRQNAAKSSVKQRNGISDCIRLGIIDQLRMFQEKLPFGLIWTNY